MFQPQSYRVTEALRHADVFSSGQHVIVDASGAVHGRYVMAAVCVDDGRVVDLLTAPCGAETSVLAECECIRWALRLRPDHTVWNDCTPAIECMLVQEPTLLGKLYWPSPRMRKPFHDLTHALSVLARDLHEPHQWQTDELPAALQCMLSIR